jgi:MFS family permease
MAGQQVHTGSYSSSILSNPADPETSPLLINRSKGLNSWSSSKSLNSEYRFEWKKEKLRCRKMFYNRIPKGKAAFVAFLVNFLESFAFYGALSLIRFALFDNHGRYKQGDTDGRSTESDFLFTVMFFTAGRVFYPIAGLLADVYLGRYRVIHIGLWLFWVGFAIILMSTALEWQYEHLSLLRKTPAILATILFMLGSASVESPIIPYGVDQIRQGASSEELSSYFFWYYFGRNGGFTVSILCSFVVKEIIKVSNRSIGISEFTNTTIAPVRNLEHTINSSVVGIIALVGITIALLLHYCFQHWFFRARQRENPLRSIFNIVYFAATVKRQAPRYRRSFRYGEGRKSRIELAKVEFDGIYSSEEVEDVKTFFRILLLVLSLGFSFVTYGAVSVTSLLFLPPILIPVTLPPYPYPTNHLPYPYLLIPVPSPF